MLIKSFFSCYFFSISFILDIFLRFSSLEHSGCVNFPIFLTPIQIKQWQTARKSQELFQTTWDIENFRFVTRNLNLQYSGRSEKQVNVSFSTEFTLKIHKKRTDE